MCICTTARAIKNSETIAKVTGNIMGILPIETSKLARGAGLMEKQYDQQKK
jgi:hypothetical protein